jgi:hypothetical protein
LSFGLLAGCTDVDLYEPMLQPKRPPDVAPNKIVGTFCLEDPATLKFPVKVFFIIDDTGSMNTNDPNERRYTEVQALAQRMAAPGEMYFGGMIFADDGSGTKTRVFTNPVFTDDVTQFNNQVSAVMGMAGGGTPYRPALDLGYGTLSDDVQKDPAAAMRTRYVVIFISDGQPTDDPEFTPVEAQTKVELYMSLTGRTGGITFNTVWLGADNPTAEAILVTMSQTGEGIHKSFPSGDALDLNGIDFSSIRRNYVQRFFMVSNLTMVPYEGGQRADSDMDGLADALERQIGSDPAKADSDLDGCNDLLEHRVGWDPLTPGNLTSPPQCTCSPSERGDTDLDGLTDCEERWIGSNKKEPDSDLVPGEPPVLAGDNVPDRYDYLYLNNTQLPDTGNDRDGDNIFDLTELAEHTSAFSGDTTERELWAYDYSRFSQQRDNALCYDFAVDNVLLARTLATAEHPANENIVEAFFLQSAQDDPYRSKVFRVARKSFPYAEGGATMVFTPDDFDQILVSVP